MKHLVSGAFARFEGKADQGVFLLTQAMGGGKTHSMIAFGLQAKRPDLRHKWMGKGAGGCLGETRVVGFTGCETDEKYHKQFLFEMAEDPACRVILKRYRWKTIAADAKAEFNKRLQRQGLKTANWKTGMTAPNREMGNEMALLAWAVEDAEPSMIPYAVKNWLGMTSEERWWLFTMTNAATGQAVKGRGKGWRKAVRYALTENPVSDVGKRGVSTFLKLRHNSKNPRKKKEPTRCNCPYSN